ncbi:MAG: metallophosphoesterase family protein [Bacteroidota bacterium]
MPFSLSKPFQHFYQLPAKEGGREFVIGDIHGHLKTLEALLDKIALTKSDRLILLGDYINRGPRNAGVLNLILKLLAKGYEVYPLRGNHEQMALDSHKGRLRDRELGRKSPPSSTKKKGLVGADKLLFPIYLDLFKRLPFYYETPTHFFVHAGFDFKQDAPF